MYTVSGSSHPAMPTAPECTALLQQSRESMLIECVQLMNAVLPFFPALLGKPLGETACNKQQAGFLRRTKISMSQLVASDMSAFPSAAGGRPQTLRDWSLQADSSQLPFAFHRVCITVLRCPCSVAMLRPVLASHTFTRPSLLPLASTAFVGCQSQLLTSPP